MLTLRAVGLNHWTRSHQVCVHVARQWMYSGCDNAHVGKRRDGEQYARQYRDDNSPDGRSLELCSNSEAVISASETERCPCIQQYHAAYTKSV